MDERTSQEATPNRGAVPPSSGSSPFFDPRDLIPTPLFCVSPEGRLVWMNAAAEALTGRHAASVAGDPFPVLLPDETARRAIWQVLRQRCRGVTDFYLETAIVTAGSEARWVGLHVRLATAANGRSAYVCAAHDLHEIHAEHELLTRRNRELRARLEEATAGAELKSAFLATMSSELRSPMNGVLGMTRLLLDSPLDRDQRTWAEVIQASGEQLLDLVDDILDYSRIGSGQLAIGSMDFDLRVTVDAVASLLATRAQQAGVGFSCLVHHRVPSLLNGDPGRLRQVIHQLASCALEQAQGGEVQVRVELVEETAHQAVVRFGINRVGGTLGGDPATEAALLAAYTGGGPDGEAAGKLGGRALGLTIARRLVTLMGGDGGGQPVGDFGSKLWFRVPLGKQDERPASLPVPADAAARAGVAGMRVLLADADPAARAALGETIGAWGGTCDVAENGLDALERVTRAAHDGQGYGSLLVDLEIDGLDAETLARSVRADEALAALPLVLLTSLGRPGDAARAESWGYDAYLVKPVEPADLEGALAVLATRGPGGHLVTRHTVAESRRRGVRVLVVEENPIDQLVIASALRRVGYTAEIAPTVEQAEAVLARGSADLLFVDLAAGGDEDHARAARLRHACDSSGGASRIPIVALLGRVRDEEIERCRATGIDDWLAKPVDLEALVGIVGRWAEARGEEEPAAESVEEVPTAPAPALPASDSVAFEPVAAEDVVAEPAAAPDVAAEPAPPPPVAPEVATPSAPLATLVTGGSSPLDELPVFDLESLERASMGNPEIRGLLVDAFLTRTRQPLDRLRKAAEWKDTRALATQAKAMRAMCQAVGAARCAAALGALELQAAAERLDEAMAALERVEAELAAVRASWNAITSGEGGLERAA